MDHMNFSGWVFVHLWNLSVYLEKPNTRYMPLKPENSPGFFIMLDSILFTHETQDMPVTCR